MEFFRDTRKNNLFLVDTTEVKHNTYLQFRDYFQIWILKLELINFYYTEIISKPMVFQWFQENRS